MTVRELKEKLETFDENLKVGYLDLETRVDFLSCINNAEEIEVEEMNKMLMHNEIEGQKKIVLLS